jgi:dTDP-4-amino-4,6-dideoxy-D-galactose acyltransferase
MIRLDSLQNKNSTKKELCSLLDERKVDLAIYSPYSFLHSVEKDKLSEITFIEPLINNISTGSCQIKCVDIKGYRHFFICRHLAWDTEYFKRRVCRIELVLFEHRKPDIISKAINHFIDNNILKGDYYFVNVPCEDITLLQGLSLTGFKLIETRLNYYFPDIRLAEPPNYPVRRAEKKDIPALKDVAMRMRNKFDRIHADPAFSEEIADAYLGKFIEESVKGFADMVIVPDMEGTEPFGFLAANNPNRILNLSISKLVLAAIDNIDHRGWLYYLLSGVMYELRKLNTDILTTITQASNRPAIRTWEKAGFLLGYVTHIYSYSK